MDRWLVLIWCKIDIFPNQRDAYGTQSSHSICWGPQCLTKKKQRIGLEINKLLAPINFLLQMISHRYRLSSTHFSFLLIMIMLSFAFMFFFLELTIYPNTWRCWNSNSDIYLFSLVSIHTRLINILFQLKRIGCLW